MAKDYDLTREEKFTVVMAHLKALSTQKYNAEMSLLEENSLAQPSQDVLDQINLQISNTNAKIEALEQTLVQVLG
jgi:hypothetical protein